MESIKLCCFVLLWWDLKESDVVDGYGKLGEWPDSLDSAVGSFLLKIKKMCGSGFQIIEYLLTVLMTFVVISFISYTGKLYKSSLLCYCFKLWDRRSE